MPIVTNVLLIKSGRRLCKHVANNLDIIKHFYQCIQNSRYMQLVDIEALNFEANVFFHLLRYQSNDCI